MKYLKRFSENSQYETFKNGSDFITPNVSFVIEDNLVHYNAAPPYDFEIIINSNMLTDASFEDVWQEYVTENPNPSEIADSIYMNYNPSQPLKTEGKVLVTISFAE